MIEKYYEEELRYLYESGKEFAKAHPQRARFLNIDAVGDRDPYIERLFEGFAFLAARIREKLDDSFPELTENLINLLWPDFLHEIPSLTIVQFKPRQNFLQETRILPRGAELLSNPVGPESVTCRFVTTSQLRLNPISLVSVEKSVDTKRRASLTFNFTLETGATFSKLKLSPLRIYLHAEHPTAFMLYEYLSRHIIECEVIFDDGEASHKVLPSEAITAGGFEPEESLLPGHPAAFRGYALLREYFIFPEKFMFVDLHGFESEKASKLSPKTISYKVTFDRDFAADKPFSTENFRLFCSPAVNLFRRNIEPIAHSAFKSEYRLIADAEHPFSCAVHSIISIVGVDKMSGETNPYKPLYSFETKGRMLGRVYTTNYRIGPDNQRHLYLTLGGEQLSDGMFHEEGISIEAWCTNKTIPREEIREGQINKPGSGFPDYIIFSNITRPTLPCSPPKENEYQWIFLSQLASSYSSIASAEALRAALSHFDWSSDEGQRRKIEAITEVNLSKARKIINGCVIFGVEIRVSIIESNFLNSGDIVLFGNMLSKFFSTYVTLNSFVNLIIVLRPSGTELRWDSMEGTRWPI